MTSFQKALKDFIEKGVSFNVVSLQDAPCPIYVQEEIRNIIDLVTIDTYNIGMYTYLKIELN